MDLLFHQFNPVLLSIHTGAKTHLQSFPQQKHIVLCVSFAKSMRCSILACICIDRKIPALLLPISLLWDMTLMDSLKYLIIRNR